MKLGILGASAAATILSCTAAFSLEDCVSIANDLDRLSCYDQASGRTPQIEVDQYTTENWTVRQDKSAFKDTTDVYVSVLSDEPAQCGQFGTPEKAALMIRCQENSTSFFLVTDCHLTSGHDGYSYIDYRIDDMPAGKREFKASTSNRALGLWSGGNSIPFIKKIIGSDRVLMRFTPFNKNKTTVEFQTTGLEKAIAPLREACSW